MIEGALSGLLTQEVSDHLAMLIPLLLQLAGLTFAVLVDSYISRKHRKVMMFIVLLVISLIVQNYVENMIAAGRPMQLTRTILAIYGYTIRPVILVLFLYIVSPDRHYTAAWVLAGINAVVHLTALFSGICFRIDGNNHYQAGPLSGFCLYTSLILLGCFLYLTFREYGHVRRRERLIPVFNVLIIIVAIILDGNVGYNEQMVTFLTEAIVSSCVFFYIWIHIQFVREHEKALKDGQRLQLMLSQIKPHFLYNSLGAIEELCDSNPKAAREATAVFARYLRGNMNSISEEGSIPFEKELSHTRFYLELEQIRFEDALRVDYYVPCTDFLIPTLTLEPLVENAVRHGVRKNADGRGTVTIRTREYADHYEVSVMDDGPGFDPETKPDENCSHVGLQNVRERLMQVCGGTLQITSFPGKGTTAAIILPKREGDRTDERP